MQRVAVQASPDVLTAVTGRYTNGATRTPSDVHPFRKHLEDLRVGDTITAGPREVTLEDIARFAELTGDTFYAHTDEEAAKANRFFGGLWRTATWSCPTPPGSSSTRRRDRSSPTTASSSCASSRRPSRATRSP